MREDEFRFVAPRAELGVEECHSLRKMVYRQGGLFDKNVSQVVNLITVPVRPQNNQSQNAPVGSIDTIYDEEQRVNSGGGDALHANYSQRHKAIKVQDYKRKTVSNSVVTVSSLPPELHLLIFAFVRDYADVVSFGITNQYFLSLARRVLDDYFMSTLGKWAGMNIVCVGRESEPNDYPPGLFSAKELEVMRRRTYTHISGLVGLVKPFTLSDFARRDASIIRDFWPGIMEFRAKTLRHQCLHRGMESDPGYRFILSQLRPDRDTYLPPDERWILRNLTTKQIVRSDAIALSPELIHGPTIDGFGFTEILISKVC
ncbi:hypothetical protein E0Z10_g9762 [Xylaria hypoxylon]|uniref:F-box domain-containing protein n=1 Tax=Xylaria hypoxylon TaxID=37992 RepID=A0A4Z0YI64_9PEZI|nr:hypothetical protein E0Z10_g9762 [Xylaria hypoxylon]